MRPVRADTAAPGAAAIEHKFDTETALVRGGRRSLLGEDLPGLDICIYEYPIIRGHGGRSWYLGRVIGVWAGV